MKGTRSALTVASVLAFLSFACVDATGPAGPGNQANGRVSIVNDAGTPGTQATYFNDSIPVDATGVGYPSAPAPGMSASLVSLAGSGGPLYVKLKAAVAPPSVGGRAVQATSVSVVGRL